MKDKYQPCQSFNFNLITFLISHTPYTRNQILFSFQSVFLSFYFLHLVINYYEICAISIGRSLRNKKKFPFSFRFYKFYRAFNTMISCTFRTLVRFRLILSNFYFPHKIRMLQNGALSIRQKTLLSRTICDLKRAVRLVNFINSKEKKCTKNIPFISRQ